MIWGAVIFFSVVVGVSIWANVTGRTAKWHAEFLAEAEKHRQQAPAATRYFKRAALFSDAEKAFHTVLTRAVPEAAIFAKVRVADVVSAHARFSGDFLKISQKHFDWVICDPDTFEPLLAIELDDSSHSNPRQSRKDADKDSAAKEAGLALLRVPFQWKYDERALRDSIAGIINSL